MPSYSPDLNPIEMIFAKSKMLLGKPTERTVEPTSQRIGKLLELFTPDECALKRPFGAASSGF